MKALLGATLILALLFAVPVNAQCTILTQYGMAPDHDCDGVLDEMDNCPYTPNAEQFDMNRNHIGDACDLLIEEIFVNPDNQVRQGEIAHVTVRLVNNYEFPIEGITISVANNELGLNAQQQLAYLPQGEMGTLDFWLVIPKCARVKSYQFSVSASTRQGGAETQTETINVQQGNRCGTPGSPLDTTVVQMPHEIDIDVGDSILIPITIMNLGSSQATYNMRISDLGPFTTWRIDPAPTMSLPAGHDDTAYLYLATEAGVPAGMRNAEFTVVSGNQSTVVPLKIYVRQYKRPAVIPGVLIMQTIFIILLLALIIAAIIVASRSGKRKDDNIEIVDSKTDAKSEIIPTTKTTKSKRTVSVEEAEKSKLETYY